MKHTTSHHDQYETCVFCGKQLDIPKTLPISKREFYVEGAGQLCLTCFREIYPYTAS